MLDHLPVELLYEIHSFALSPALPLTCKHFYAVFKAAPTAVHADYLIGRYQLLPPSAQAYRFVTVVLAHPICTQAVLEAVLRSPLCPPIPPPDSPHRHLTILPRRLFRALQARPEATWTDDDEPLPFLRFLYSHPRVPAVATNSFDGYALVRAVYAGHVPLVRFLLAHGAAPECKGNLAVSVAIQKKSLALVRMLIERDGPAAASHEKPYVSRKRKRGVSEGEKGSASKGAPKGAKRRKLGDRVAVDQGMLKAAVQCDARDIVDYLMKEKGCSPDMQTLMLMR